MRLSVLFEQFRYSTKKINSKIYINTVTLEKWQKWKQTLRVVLALWWKIMLVWCKIARRGMVLLHFCLRGRGWYYFTVVWGEGMVLLRRCLGERDGITPLLSWGKGEERGGRQAGWRATRKVALASLNDRRFSEIYSVYRSDFFS